MVCPGEESKISSYLTPQLNKHMEQFSKEIMVAADAKRFHFQKRTNIEGVKYFITTLDERQKPISFSMKQNKDGVWSLTPGSLRWLYDIRKELADAILETRLKQS